MAAHNISGFDDYVRLLSSSEVDDRTIQALFSQAVASSSSIQPVAAATTDDGKVPVASVEKAPKYSPNSKYNKRNDQGGDFRLHNSQELALRRKISRAQDVILKCMHELTESGDIDGFVFGIVPKKGKAVSGSSDALRGWWKEKVRFDHNGPVAIAKYHAENVLGTNEMHQEAAIPRSLHEFQDSALGSMLSTLMPHCNPPQRKFPLENGISPPWWPTGDEEWWPQLEKPKQLGAPPYKKPHDLKKSWKIGVLTAVVKHMVPHMHNLVMAVRRSTCLQDKMSAKEISIWLGFVEHEARMYMQQHPQVQLPLYLLRGDCGNLAFDSPGEYDVDVGQRGNTMNQKPNSEGFQDLDLGKEGSISIDRKRKGVDTELSLNQGPYNFQYPDKSVHYSAPYNQMKLSRIGSSSNSGKNLSGLGIPDDGQQVIGGLMGYYNHDIRSQGSFRNPVRTYRDYH